jgi:flagellar hook-length control protein FliK
LKGGERMEIQGLGNNYFSLSQEKTFQSNEPGFQQVLQRVVNKNDQNQTSYSNEDNKDIKDAKAVLSFLKKSDMKEISDGKQELDNQLLNLPTDRLNIVKKLLGISDQKWSEIVAELEEKTKQNFKVDDPTEIMIEGLTFLSMNPPTEDLKILTTNPPTEGLQILMTNPSTENLKVLTTNPSIEVPTDNAILFLKAAKVYSLLSNQDGSVKQLLTGLLESVQDQIKGVVQNNQTQSRNAYLQNTFSQLVSEINEQTTENNQSDRLKTANRFTDWNTNNPFMQQMSKPEQLTMMVDGTAKSDSVNDLIQKFESILSKSQFSKMGGMQKLFIKLNPEHLGSISIELIQKGQGITARILTATEAAKEALESHLHNLKHAFEAQSIRVDNVEIGQQSSQGQADDFLNRGQSDQQQDVPQDQGSETDEQEDSSSSFFLSLEEAILNQEV